MRHPCKPARGLGTAPTTTILATTDTTDTIIPGTSTQQRDAKHTFPQFSTLEREATDRGLAYILFGSNPCTDSTMGKVLEAQGVKPITIDDTDSASWRLDLSNEISWERLKHEVMLHRPRGIFALPPLIGHNKNTDAGKRVRAVWILLLQFADWAASSQYIPTILYFDACHDASRDTHKFLLDHSSGFSIFRLHCCDKKARQHHEVYTVITGTEYNGSILSSECTLPTHNQLVSPMPGRSPLSKSW